MRIIKRSVMIVLSILFLLGSYDTSVFAKKLLIGDYISLGKYQGEDIVWRYVADDENGKLLLSGNILTFKAFNAYYSENYPDRFKWDNYWGESNIRSWLN